MIASRLIWLNNLRLRLGVLKNSFVTRTTMTKPLSPAAQAIWDAWNDAYEAQGPLEDMGQPLGAALRAAADQEKLGPDHWEGSRPDDYERGWNAALRNISRIATELDLTP
jgi:hypothetical protein